MDKAEIIAGHVATLKRLREAMAAREEAAKSEQAKREEAKRKREAERKKAWQISELARIEEGSEMKGPTKYPPAGYGGYLDGYCGAAL
jgi:hypothetical protein